MNHSISLYQELFQLQNATFSLIDHEDTMVAIVYKITQQNGTELILKICRRTSDYLREAYFLEHLAGSIPLPRLIQTVPPKTGIHGAILMEYLHGTLLNLQDLTPSLTHEIGSALARLHLHRVSDYGDLTQPQSLSPDPRVHFTLKFEEGLSECSQHLPQEILDQCRRYFDEHVHLLHAVDGPCTIHRDFRPGNVMVDQGKLQGIIDWASGRASFAEEDFCPIEHGQWGSNPTIKQSFLQGYASIRPVPEYKAMMPLLRLSRAIAIIGFLVKNETWNTLHTQVYQFNRQYLDTFFAQ
jgi:Ser/Thr protein kinase RdoA (MazF antagonist)